jgi:hypothetical protein
MSPSATKINTMPSRAEKYKPAIPDPRAPYPLVQLQATEEHPDPQISRTVQQDRITSLKLSTKDLEAETARLKEILEDKKKMLQEKKRELVGKVPRNEFARRWREVKKKGSRGGSEK